MTNIAKLFPFFRAGGEIGLAIFTGGTSKAAAVAGKAGEAKGLFAALGIARKAERAGGIWKFIHEAGEALPASGIPKHFELTVGNSRIFVAPNATKHIEQVAEGVLRRTGNPALAKLRGQGELENLIEAIRSLGSPTPLGRFTVRGWQLEFRAARSADPLLLPVLNHARYIGS